MKKMKKILALICALALVLGTIVMPTVNAAEGIDDYKVQMLKGLGILDVTHIEDYTYIEKGQFIEALSKFMRDDDTDAETVARIYGLISIDEEFDTTAVLPIHEAVKYAVIVLGYKTLINDKNPDKAAYLNEANRIGLMNGVDSNTEKLLRPADAVAILCNMIEIEPVALYYNSETDKGYKICRDETLLSINRNIEKISGIVTKNSKTAMDDDSGCAEGKIEISGTLYETTFEQADSYLGRTVTAYVQSSDLGDETVLFMYDKATKNVDLKISGRKVKEIASDFSYIKYEDPETAKTKTAKLSLTPSVIYNGKFYSNYTAEDLTPSSGELNLIDNDNDGRYDVIKVTDCYTMVVDTASQNPGMIYGKIALPSSVKTLDLEKNDRTYEIISEGVKASLSLLSSGSIISVAESKDGSFLSINVSNTTLVGNLNGIYFNDKEVEIDGVRYAMTDEFADWYVKGAGSPERGVQYTFYQDAYGSVAYMEYNPESTYMLYLRSYCDSDVLEDCYKVKYMTTAGEWNTAELAKKVTYNGTVSSKADVYNEIVDLNPQVVVIKTNSKGEITTFKTAIKKTKSTTLADFTYVDLQGAMYQPQVSGFGGIVYHQPGTVMFLLSENNSKHEEDYSIATIYSGFFREWIGYNLTAYDLDEYFTAPIFSAYDTDYLHEQRSLETNFFITGVSEVVDDDGEIKNAITGVWNTALDFQLIEGKDGLFDGLKKGDYIHFTQNNKGKVDYIKMIGNINNPEESTEAKSTFSTVVSVDAANMRIKYSTNGTEYVTYVAPWASAKFYNVERGTCRVGKLSELRPGQKIICTISYYQIIDLIAAE